MLRSLTLFQLWTYLRVACIRALHALVILSLTLPNLAGSVQSIHAVTEKQPVADNLTGIPRSPGDEKDDRGERVQLDEVKTARPWYLTTAAQLAEGPDNPSVLFIENVKLYGSKAEVPDGEHLVPFGRARILKEGTDVTLVAISGTVPESLAAAEELLAEGISTEVIDPRTLNPLDTRTIAQSLRKTGRLVITHDAYRTCGVAAEISQRMMEEAFDYLNAPIVRVTGLDVPVPSGPLHFSVVPDRRKIIAAVQNLSTH